MEPSWIDTHFRALDKGDPLSRAMGWAREETRERPVVLDGDRPYGILDTRTLMSRSRPPNMHIHKLAMPVPCLQHDASEAEVLATFTATLAPYLPVVDGRGLLCGVVTAATASQAVPPDVPIAAAVQDIPTLAPSDALEVAAHHFGATTANRLPILENRVIVGALARATLHRAYDRAQMSAGKRDFGGESVDVLDETVAGYSEASWAAAPVDDADAVRACVAANGYALVTRGKLYAGYVDPNFLIRAAHAAVTARV